MRNLVAWGILIGVFFVAGEGLNLFRTHIEWYLASGSVSDVVWAAFGLLLGLAATAFLGGYIYHRDKKRGKLKREGWRGRPVPKRHRPSRD
ncbi:DUF2627 family protein [Alicyclobacillus pomorum]|jgi:hypothetical protein|uniref:DUF2627 family protein n=1 Tax=Alicyclobacillus pomorum TaxID=204470 RepID=UPI0004168E37|nr:DUF2627 family protein [Alicyclobacillus pomorum]